MPIDTGHPLLESRMGWHFICQKYGRIARFRPQNGLPPLEKYIKGNWLRFPCAECQQI